MPEEVRLEYPQITGDQFELWEANPVTKAYLRCLAWKEADTVEHTGTGRLVDSSNADMTHALVHRSLGQQDAYKEAALPEKLLEFYRMVYRPPPPAKEETDE